MKKKSTLIACLALVGVVGLGSTLALLSDKTDEKKNMFTIGSGIDGDIFEPNWPGNDGSDVEYKPDSSIKKDPQIMNQSEKDDAYIGMKLTYVLPTDAYEIYNSNNKTQHANNAAVIKALGYDSEEAYIKAITGDTVYNTAKSNHVAKPVKLTIAGVEKNVTEQSGYWVELAGVANGYKYVNDDGSDAVVKAGAVTEPIFDTVEIIDTVDIKGMLPFEIHAQGYLVQVDNDVVASTALASLMNEK